MNGSAASGDCQRGTGMAGAWALLAATTRPVLAGLALAMYGFAAVW